MKLELKAFQTSLWYSLFIEQKYSFLKVQVENSIIINEKVKSTDYINDAIFRLSIFAIKEKKNYIIYSDIL